MLGQRSTQCHQVRTSAFEAELRSRIRAFAVTHPATATAASTSGSCEIGSRSTANRVRRLSRAEGLRVVPVRRRKPKVRCNSIEVRGSHSEHVWAIDLPRDEIAEGRPTKIGERHGRVHLQSFGHQRRAPDHRGGDDGGPRRGHGCTESRPRVLRMDNGPEFIADALQDWCELTDIKTSFCDPASAWWNGRIESLNSRLRDELRSRWVFDSTRGVRTMLEVHRQITISYRTHCALGYLTPEAFAAK